MDLVESLRGMRILASEAVLRGQPVFLSCDYDLEEASLYSIKWYLNDQEFYRYVPKESPPTRVFALPGLHVDVSNSDSHGVMLLNASRPLTGQYKCEVSADAPLFHTDIRSTHLTVVESPISGPEIHAEKSRYSSGETIRANCTSPPSYPPANITWYLNEQLAENSAVYQVEPGGSSLKSSSPSGSGHKASVSRLQLEAGSGKLRIRCESSLFNVYRGTSQILELRQDSPRPASVLGPGSVDNGASLGVLHSLLIRTLAIMVLLR